MQINIFTKMNYLNVNNIAHLFIYGLLLIFLFSFILPIQPSMPNSGLDPSHQLTMHHAFMNNFEFGKDIYFTFGPLSDFWFPIYFYSETTYKVAIFLSSLLAFTIFLSLVLISKNANLLFKIIGFLAIMIGLKLGGNFLWYIIPILFVQIVLLENENRKLRLVLSGLLLFFLSFSVLVKFSHFPTAILAVLLIDGYFYIKTKTKIPLYTLLFFTFMILLFVMSGQNITNFVAYFIGSFNTLSGYSESMQLFGSSKMIYIHISLSILMLIVLMKPIIKSKDIKTYIFIFISALVLFMAFKNGFVRHDGHAIAAYSGLSFVFGLLLLHFSRILESSAIKFSLSIVIVVLALVSSLSVFGYYNGNKQFYKVLSDSVLDIKNRFFEIPNLIKHSKIEQLNTNYKSSIENIKNQIDFSDINGTVDIYPWDQSFVIAHGLDFRPRPLFQSYSVYTPYLIEKNIEFLNSDRSAETILFSIKEIDGRAPFMMEGASWLDLMKLYDIVDNRGEFLVLKKSKNNKEYHLTEYKKQTVKFGQSIEIDNKKAVYAKIDIKKSFFGKATNTLFKSPVLNIVLTYENGNMDKFRIVPSIASSGFILSPTIKNINDYFAFVTGSLNKNKVKSIKLINKFGCCYSDDIEIELYEISTQGFDLYDNQSNKLKKLLFYNNIVSFNSNLKAPFFQTENYNGDNIVFLHVGMKFIVNGKLLQDLATDAKNIEVLYAIKKEAYTNGNNCEGACFKIFKNNDLLYSNCINPKDIEADRKLKSFLIENIEENQKYTFEVLPIEGKSSAYGWSYWKFEGDK